MSIRDAMESLLMKLRAQNSAQEDVRTVQKRNVELLMETDDVRYQLQVAC